MSKRSVLLCLLMLTVMAGALGWVYQTPPKVLVRLCLPKSPASGLPILALDQGYFEDEGLDVKIEVVDLGRGCVERLVSGKVELTASNIPPIVTALTKGHHLMVITELTTSTRNTSLVFPKTENKESVSRFQGRKVGLVKGTNSETFLRLYLKSHDMDPAEMKITEAQSLKELGEFLNNGTVESAVMWEPFLSQFLKASSPKQYVTQDSPFYSQFCVLASTSEYATSNSETIQKFIRAVDKAHEYAEKERESSRQTVMAYLKFTEAELPPEVWAKFRMDIGLSAVLISMMEESQKPLILPPGTEDQAPPFNVFQALYPQALRQIGKDLVTYE